MAITAIEYALLSYFKQNGGLPQTPNVLELGEANWFGDMPAQQLANDIDVLITDDATKNKLVSELNSAIQEQDEKTMRKIARIFYSTFLNHDSLTAIDPHGSSDALALDLNKPVGIDRQFDLCLNFGTAENIFNIYQFFQTTHQLTQPGGVMIHGTSLSGWYTQGLYSFKPSFYWKLAEANQYKILAFVYAELHPLKLLELNSLEEFARMDNEGQIANNALLYVVLEKDRTETEFSAPAQ